MFFSKKIIGIDIGVGSVKIVEISKSGKKKNLLNYGELRTEFIKDTIRENPSRFSNDSIAAAIRAILSETGIKTKEAVFSIPDFSTFFTSFDIPQMPHDEIPGAVHYNASQFITLPISEVTLDWQVMKKNPDDRNSPIRVLLIAIPNKLIQDYQMIARLAGLDLYAMEAEAFGITRALCKDDKKIICLIDIGAETSTINIAEGAYLRRSYSFNFSSNQITNSLSSLLQIDKDKAEELKIKEGLLSQDKNIINSISALVDPLISEINIVIDDFMQKENQIVQEVYLTGGAANMPGLKKYFADKLSKGVVIGNCFLDIAYPMALEKNILEISSSFSGATGVALFKFES